MAVGVAGKDGTWDKTKRKANEVVGAATGDRSQEMEGKGRQVKGEAKDRP